MRKTGFTLIELLAVIAILAIISLIATPTILGIIKDTKKESNERSVKIYADALKTAIAEHQLSNNKNLVGKYKTNDGKILNGNVTLKVDYDGNVVCDTIEIYEDDNFYLTNCEVDGNPIEYTYGERYIPQSISFEEDSWETIVENVKLGNLSKYNIGDTKEIALTGFTNSTNKATFTVRIANISTPSECATEGFSKTACGFVIEFVDVLAQHNMNSESTSVGGWKDSEMRKYINNTIYNALPEDLREVIINTDVVSGHELGPTENYKTKDKLYLLSSKEVWGDNVLTDTAKTETRQLDYYKAQKVSLNNSSSAIKKYNSNPYYWWLRSTRSTSDNSFNIVIADGTYSQCTANVNYGFSPAFRIG